MDLEQRLNHLERHHDWSGLAEALEQAIASTQDPVAKAELHLRLGRLLHERFLHGVKALKHFQDAFKLNPALGEALAEARRIYWDLGKLNMVQKLLELQLKNSTETSAPPLYRELGDVFCDLGDYERAADAYARAMSDGQSGEVGQLLDDVMVGTEDWQERIGVVLRTAHEAADAALKATAFLRAARIARRYAPEEVEGILAKAYTSDPQSLVAAALFEGLLADANRADTILQVQQEVLSSIGDTGERAEVAFRYGVRWALRHQNVEAGTQLIEEALKLDPSHEPAFAFLRETWGTRESNWERVIELAEELAGRAGATPAGAFMLAQAGTVLWRELGDLIRARSYFERLAATDPEHPALSAFEAQIGDRIVAGSGASPEPPAVAPSPEPPPADESPAPPPASEPPEAPPPARQSVPAASNHVPDDAKIAELRAQLEEQEGGKRPHEYVKTLIALADELSDTTERVELYLKAADLYVNKFVNQAEAVRTFERVLEVDPANREAIEYLRQMYEKRRDWEKLIQLRTGEAKELPQGAARTEAFKEIAKLATERVKKPDVCIDLWAVVLENDPEDADAIESLAQLYERARDYEKLADMLEKQAEITYDTNDKLKVLTKLGQVVGDRLKDDVRAAEAYRQLLTLSPDDRRAQEQLKKRYVSLGRWDDLEVFYAESGKWDEFIRVLESNEAKADTNEQRIGMLMKIAELWMTQKGKPDRSARAYEKILGLDENNLAAAERLIPIYTDANNPKGLSNAIEVKLSHLEDPTERLGLLREVAGLYETRINDKSKSFERYLAAFEIAPTDDQSQADVERVAALTGNWEEVVTAYRSAIERAQSDGDAYGGNALRLRLGRILVDEAGRVDEALSEYRAVYENEPENTVALEALEKLYRQTERWKDLLDVYAKKRDLAGDAEEKKAILYEIARVYEGQVGDAPSAIETYQAVLEDDPADAVALEALDRLYRETERWDSYADILRRRIELDASEAELVDLKYRLAGALGAHLGDDSGALTNYREILFLNQDHEGARLALENMLTHESLRADAAAILEAIYEVREDWEKLIGALEILAVSDSDPSARVQLLRKIALVAANQLGALDRAIDAQARALKEDPALPDSRLELEQLAEAASAWDKVIAIYSDVAAGLDDPVLARDYWMRLASIEEQLSMVDKAASSYERVLALDPGDAEALAAMDALYRRTEHWDDLIGVFRRRIDLAEDGGERESLYGQMAAVFEERLGRPAEAIAAYREVLALDPTSQVALSALDGLFTRQGLWSELAENLETQLTLAPDDLTQMELMLRLAGVRETQMNDIEAAIEGYRQVLDREPTSEAARGALERLGQMPDYELTIAEILEPLYRQQGDYGKLIGVHEVQVRRAEDAGRKVELLHQVAGLYEDAAGDINSAFDTLARALAADPAHEETQQALDRLARVTGRFEDLARVFEELGSQQQDPELASQLYTFAARVFESDVANIDRAIELYRQVLKIDAANLGAAEALQALFQSTERYSDMSQILQRKATILEDMDDQKNALYQAAGIEEEVLERKEFAINVYMKILEIDPEDLRSIDSLVNLYLGLGRWEDLLGVYQKKVDLVLDIDEKKLIYYQVGAVHERELSDVARAIDTYQKVLELDPDDLTALGRLDVLYQTAENWQELLSILQHEAELTQDPAEAVSFQYRIAELYEKHLGDVERAVELYRDILNILPDHAPTLTALEGIKNGERAPLAAAGVLEPVYDAMGEWQRLVSVLEVQVRFADDPYAKVDLLHRVARLYEENLGDHASAFDTYARAVSVDSQNEESLSSLERLANLIERWPAVAQIYDAELDKLAEQPEQLVELGLRVAQVYEVQLEDVNSAVARYRRVLGADPENQSAVRSLDRLFTQTERWQELAEILKTRERHRPDSRGDPRVQVPARAGVSAPTGRPSSSDRGVPRGDQRGAGARSDPAGPRGPVRGWRESAGGRRDPRAAVSSGCRVGKAHPRPRGGAPAHRGSG